MDAFVQLGDLAAIVSRVSPSYNTEMGAARRYGWAITAALSGCGPAVDTDDVYPRNCGVDGPVALFEVAPKTYVDVKRAGDYYLVQVAPDGMTIESWAVDRCGQSRVRLQPGPQPPTAQFNVAGDLMLSCDEATGAMAIIDPTGVERPREIFESVEACRVVRVGGGLAAQQKGGATVWFHADPLDPSDRAIVVTTAAVIADPNWIFCWPTFDCDSDHPFGTDIRAAGDDLLVAMQDETLLAFSTTTLESRTIDEGPLFAMDVLSDERHVIIDRHLGPTFVFDRETGTKFEFCCYRDIEPIRRLGDWIVQGSWGPPIIPEPPQWKNFQAHDLATGARTFVEGQEDWRPFARLDADTLLADIGPAWSTDETRYVVWPATGERRSIDIPGDRYDHWTLPEHDGVFIADEETLRFVAGPDATPRVLAEEAWVVFPNRRGRVVLEDPREVGEASPLWVLLPDARVVEIDPAALESFRVPAWSDEGWPTDRDEVVYVTEDAGQWIVRRTVLP